MAIEGNRYSGGLFLRATSLEAIFEALPGVTIQEEGSPVPGWSRIAVRSREPLYPGDRTPNGPAAELLEYRGFVRRSGQRFVFMTNHTEVSEAVLERPLSSRMIFSPRIDIPRLVKDFSESPATYVLSAIWARVPGEADALRSISLFGADICRATIFNSHLLPLMTPHRVALRHVGRGVEVISVSNTGAINFLYRDESSLAEIDNALRILTLDGYIDWGEAPVIDND